MYLSYRDKAELSRAFPGRQRKESEYTDKTHEDQSVRVCAELIPHSHLIYLTVAISCDHRYINFKI